MGSGGLPWEQPSPQQPHRPQHPPVPPAQNMRPDPPTPQVTARNPQTGQQTTVNLSDELREALRQAITGAVVENKDQLQANAQAAITGAVTGKKLSVTAAVPEHLKGTELEDNFSYGPATKRTLLQGLAVDMGFAAMAALATVTSGEFDPFDKEAWTIVGVLMLKTVLQTGMSYMMRLKVS